MGVAEGSEVLVFETESSRQRSRRFYIFLLKLTLIPFLMIMGFLSGALLENTGLPQGIRVACSLILGISLPWLALRALNRRLRFRFALHPDGLECGPGKFRWLVPYNEVGLVRASHFEQPGDPYLEVKSASKSGWVIMDPAMIVECATAILDRCPCAVWMDNRAEAYPPRALEAGSSAEMGQRALRNMELLRQTYQQAVRRVGAIALVFLAVMIGVATTYLGIFPIDPKTRTAITIGPVFFAAVFGFEWLLLRRKLRLWEEVCQRFSGSVS